MAGTGTLTLTGQLGDVMKESALAALSWFRAHAAAYGADPDFFKNAEIHLHIPSGAIPKDGPSAGVTMFTALASLLTGRRVRSDVAMTGEATLRGRVLPIGGLKEKSLAAFRAGIKTILIPERNEKDLDEIPKPLRRKLRWVIAKNMSDVLKVALIDRVKPIVKSRSAAEKTRLRAGKNRLAKRAVRPVTKKPRERSVPLRP